MLVQSWIKPLVYLQTTLGLYDYAPDLLLNKTKWVSEKLISLEQGVVVLIKKVSQNALLDYYYNPLVDNDAFLFLNISAVFPNVAVQMLNEGVMTTAYSEQDLVHYDVQPDMLESVMRDYTLLSCFKKDAHKMEILLKLLKCRQNDTYNCV